MKSEFIKNIADSIIYTKDGKRDIQATIENFSNALDSWESQDKMNCETIGAAINKVILDNKGVMIPFDYLCNNVMRQLDISFSNIESFKQTFKEFISVHSSKEKFENPSKPYRYVAKGKKAGITLWEL